MTIMKKQTLSFVCLMVVGALGVRAQTAKIILQHGDKATFFKSDQLQDAIDESEDGDVIYLNKGTFKCAKNKVKDSYDDSYYVEINKNISIIGAGANKTDIRNRIYVDNCRVVMEDLEFTFLKNIQNLESLSLTRCHSSSGLRFYGNDGLGTKHTILNLFVVQCQLKSIDFDYTMNAYDYTEGLAYGHVKNSIIEQVNCSYFTGEINFKNCNLGAWNDSSYGHSEERCVTIENSIIHGIFSDKNYGIRAKSMTNCLYDRALSGFTKSVINCWRVANLFDDNFNCTMTDEQMINAGYIGTDNTVVGINGGDFPFNNSSTRPNGDNYKIDIDPETRKMTIKL